MEKELFFLIDKHKIVTSKVSLVFSLPYTEQNRVIIDETAKLNRFAGICNRDNKAVKFSK